MLGYDETSVTRNMTIAVTNAGTVDGADTVTEVGIANCSCPMQQSTVSTGQPPGRDHVCIFKRLTSSWHKLQAPEVCMAEQDLQERRQYASQIRQGLSRHAIASSVLLSAIGSILLRH